MLCVPDLPIKKKYKSLAVLTSGGDAPGMNAAIRSVVRYSIVSGLEVYGVSRGYDGLLEGQFEKMQLASVANIIQRGGTILKTSRCEAFLKKSVRKEAANLLKRKGIEALVVIGGDGSFAGAHLLQQETKFPVICVPGTIDNDILHSEETIGYDTAINTALEAIDKIRDTAHSHERIFLIEVMGKSSGFIAMQVGISGGAETVLVPEYKTTINDVCQAIDRSANRGKCSSIIIVAEGQKPGLTTQMSEKLEEKGYPARVCILGHTQRGGTPTAHDRYLASVLGASAVAHLLAGHSDCMIAVQKNQVCHVPLKDVIGKKKPLPSEILKLAQVLAT